MDDDPDFLYDEDKLGMRVTSGAVALTKDANNLIGISIGGGAVYCPCIYVVQIFDNTPAALDASLEAGDEITAVDRTSVKGKTKSEVARMIQSAKNCVTIQYNKLHADPKQGKTLDIVLKKLKHKFVENMSSEAADALGLSRAILCNDTMVKKLNELETNAMIYKTLVEHTRQLFKIYYNLASVYKEFGDIFAEIGAKESQISASEAFMTFGEVHRNMEKQGVSLLKVLKPMVNDLSTYLNKAIPDTRLTVKKYLDVKFEYLSYCLKIKEMDDEEQQFAALQEPLYRVETGNYEYRLILRCRQDARARFAKLRSDVLVKMELLDSKRVQDTAFQLQRLVKALSTYHTDCKSVLEPTRNLFPIEVDLSQVAVKYNTTGQLPPDEDFDQEDDQETGDQNARGIDFSAREAKEDDDQPILDLGTPSSSTAFPSNDLDDLLK